MSFKKVTFFLPLSLIFIFGNVTFVFASVCLPRWSPVGDATMCLARSQTDIQCITDGMCKWQTCQDAPGANNPPLHCFSKAPDDCKSSPECSLSESKREISVVLQDPNITARDKAPIENPSGTCLAKLDPENIQYVCNKTSDCVKNSYCVWKPKPQAAPTDKSKVTSGNSTGPAEDLLNKAKSLNQVSFTTPQQFIGQGIKVLVAFIGSILLLLYVYAGILWMIAAGNSEQITKAKHIMVWASLGVVAMLASYLLIDTLFKLL